MLSGSGEYRIDNVQKRIVRGKKSWRVTPRALELLAYLHSRRGELVSSNQILDALYHNRDFADVANVQVQISTLRKRVAPDVVDTVHGYGYGVGIEL